MVWRSFRGKNGWVMFACYKGFMGFKRWCFKGALRCQYIEPLEVRTPSYTCEERDGTRYTAWMAGRWWRKRATRTELHPWALKYPPASSPRLSRHESSDCYSQIRDSLIPHDSVLQREPYHA
jgi:hypothetical protein